LLKISIAKFYFPVPALLFSFFKSTYGKRKLFNRGTEKKRAKRIELLTSSATNANSTVAEVDAPKKN
jgi:hypothetical protein